MNQSTKSLTIESQRILSVCGSLFGLRSERKRPEALWLCSVSDNLIRRSTLPYWQATRTNERATHMWEPFTFIANRQTWLDACLHFPLALNWANDEREEEDEDTLEEEETMETRDSYEAMLNEENPMWDSQGEKQRSRGEKRGRSGKGKIRRKCLRREFSSFSLLFSYYPVFSMHFSSLLDIYSNS